MILRDYLRVYLAYQFHTENFRDALNLCLHTHLKNVFSHTSSFLLIHVKLEPSTIMDN